MTSDIDVTVIVPVYNAGGLLERCLDSIFKQKTNRSIEVILVDDGSTDNSVEIIRQRPEQDHIRLFQQANSGPSKARNIGIKEARGKYLAFLDADDYWMPMFIEQTALFLDANNDTIAVSVGQRHITWKGEHISPSFLKEENSEFDAPVVLDNFFAFWCQNNHICTGSIMIRSQVAKVTGGMREDLRQCEDLEFWAVLACKGKLGFIPEILFVSDGSKIALDHGWVNKMRKRWENTPAIDNWIGRLNEMNDFQVKQNRRNILRKVALPLIYDKLLTNRWVEGRQEALKYGKYLPALTSSKVVNLAKHSIISWWLLRVYIRYKEFHRK